MFRTVIKFTPGRAALGSSGTTANVRQMSLSNDRVKHLVWAGLVLSTAELVKKGASRMQLARLVASGDLDRPARGYYRRARRSFEAEIAILALMHPECVIGLLSAARLHGWIPKKIRKKKCETPQPIWALVERLARRPKMDSLAVLFIYWTAPPQRTNEEDAEPDIGDIPWTVNRRRRPRVVDPTEAPKVQFHLIHDVNVPVTEPAQTAEHLAKFHRKVGEKVAASTLRQAFKKNRKQLEHLRARAADPRNVTVADCFIRKVLAIPGPTSATDQSV